MSFKIAASECGGAHIRAHFRHSAMVVTIHGRLDAGNLDQVRACIRRFVLADNHLVLDLSDVNSSDAEQVSLVSMFAEVCLAADVEWALVASDAVAAALRERGDEAPYRIAQSVNEALSHFADVAATRRQLLLPLFKKPA